MFAILHVALCHDSLDTEELAWQNRALSLIFQDFSDAFKRRWTKGNTLRPFCEWDSGPLNLDFKIKCENGRMTALICQSECENINIFLLPHYVQRIELMDANQSFVFDVRWLPRDLEFFYMWHNTVTGTLDLTSLPERMKRFSVLDNELTGGLNLTHLPDTLEELDVTRNHFVQKLLPYKLPPSVRMVDLRWNDDIEQVVPLTPQDSVRKKKNVRIIVQYGVSKVY